MRSFTFERVSQEVIACPVAIQPHPHGIEFGQLKRMAAASEVKLLDFLVESFSRVGKKSAQEMCDRSGLKGTLKVKGLSTEDLKKLLAAMQDVAVPAPPATQCLSPIGEELLRRGLEKEFQMDFVASRTRPSSVFSGHSFMVEAAIGYGGRLPPEGNAILLRFANRVPLMYQQGACAITECVTGINWKSYNISLAGRFPDRAGAHPCARGLDQCPVHEREQGCDCRNPGDRKRDHPCPAGPWPGTQELCLAPGQGQDLPRTGPGRSVPSSRRSRRK